MANTPVTAQVHQPLNIHGDVTTQITFNTVFAINNLAQPSYLTFRQLVDTAGFGYARFLANFMCLGTAYSKDIGQSNHNPLVGRDVDSGDSCQFIASSRKISRKKSARPLLRGA
jgi:hypothetical protein